MPTRKRSSTKRNRSQTRKRKTSFLNIQKATQNNKNYRKVIYTGVKQQVVVMNLKPQQQIGIEVHPTREQFFRIEAGHASFNNGNGKHLKTLKAGQVAIVPPGVTHNVTNPSKTAPLKLYTIYSPPEHPPGTIQKTKP